LFVAMAVAAALVCIRLGFWQLHRLEQRRARNALVSGRYAASPVDPSQLPRDTTAARFMRVRVAGVPDYAHELIYAARTYKGSPGVNLLTPVRIPGRDTAILVNRGWVYSPDGATVNLNDWHDRDSVFIGYADELPSTGGSTYTSRPQVIAHLSYDVIAKALPYPVSPTYVVALGDSANASDRVARLSLPPLDEGPHLGYAIQWFAFAAVALIGTGIVIRQARLPESTPKASAASSGSATSERD
jgi:surfeit locus 1 family protein